MLKLQCPKVSFRQASMIFTSFILRNRSISSPSFQYRGYAKAPNNNDGRIIRKILEEEEESLSSQTWGSYIIPAALVMLVGTGAFIRNNDEKRAILKGSEQSTGIGKADTNKPAIGGPFKLFDTKNHLVTESNLKGNWMLLYFGCTCSPDAGPAELTKMAKAIDILESEHNLKIKPLYITVDPQRDSPDHLQAYLEEFDPRIIGLWGPNAAVRQIAQEYRVFFKKVDEEGQDYLVECSQNMYLVDPNMDTLRWFGTEYDASQLADGILHEVKKALK